jgi:hypothetical protein
MAIYTQSELSLLTQARLSFPGNVTGTPVDVSTRLSGVAYIWKGVTQTTADLQGGLDYMAVEVSGAASGNDWYEYFRALPTTTAAVTVSLSTAANAGDTVLSVANTTGFNPGALCFLTCAANQDTQSEWVRIVSVVANTSITIKDGLAYAKAIGDALYTSAEQWAVPIDLGGVKRVRALAVHRGATGSNWVCKATMTTANSIG